MSARTSPSPDPPDGAERGDEWTSRLARLFLEHPAWVSAADRLSDDASSTVYFSHRRREPWKLCRRRARTRLLPGASPDPDLVFRFTPASIERLESVEGGLSDFAVTLFTLILEGEVGLRIVAGFGRLAMRGYLRLLLDGGPALIAFGAAHGVGTLGALRRLVAELRSRAPADWEPR